MTKIRQLYLYGISAVSLLFLATGTENLIRLLIQTAAGTEPTGWLWLNRGSLRQQISFFAALTIINLPVWIGHWLAANRQLSDADRASAIRRFYLYLVMAGALLFFVPGAIGLIRIPLWAILQAPIQQPFANALAAPIGLIAVTVPIWIYHRRLARAEAATTGEDGGLGTSRRLYDYGASFVLLNFLLVNLSRLATSVWEEQVRAHVGVLVGDSAWASLSLPALAAATAVTLTLWWWHWGAGSAVAAGSDRDADAELQSLPRRLMLYGTVLVCLIVAAVNASTLLNDLFRSLLGASDPSGSGRSLLDALGQPIAWGLAYGAFWLYYRWWLQRDADRARAATDQAALRQLYYYLVAAVGLALFAVGLILLLTTLLALPNMTPAQAAADWFRERVSDASTLVVVGAPIWLGHWLHQQQLVAEAPESQGERHATWRRIYLYLALFTTVVAVLVDAASVLYQLFLVALGDTGLPGLLEAVRTPVSVIAVAGVLLWYHWGVLRADVRVSETRPTTSPVVAAILLRAATPDDLDAALGLMTGGADRGAEATVLRDPQLENQIAATLRRWRAL